MKKLQQQWNKIIAPTEQKIQKEIKDFLISKGATVVKFNNSGIYREGKYIPTHQSGVSDLLVCLKGRFIAIEVKRPNGRLTENQKAFLKQIEKSNGVALVATSVEDVKEALSFYLT